MNTKKKQYSFLIAIHGKPIYLEHYLADSFGTAQGNINFDLGRDRDFIAAWPVSLIRASYNDLPAIYFDAENNNMQWQVYEHGLAYPYFKQRRKHDNCP